MGLSLRASVPLLLLSAPALPGSAQGCDLGVLAGWPLLDRTEFIDSVTLADVHPDPGMEAVITTTRTVHVVEARGRTLFKLGSDGLDRYKPAFADRGDGNLQAEGSFPVETPSVDPIRLAPADLDGDRDAELLAIGHDQPPRVFHRRSRVLAWHGELPGRIVGRPIPSGTNAHWRQSHRSDIVVQL